MVSGPIDFHEPLISGDHAIPKAETSAPRTPALDISITHALPRDAPAIARIGAKTFTEAFGFSVPPDDLAAYLAATYTAGPITSEILDPATPTFVARESRGGVVRGFVQLVRSLSAPCVPRGEEATAAAAQAELRRLYVDAEAHGRGIGKKLIAAVEAQAREEGFGQLWLTVWEENLGAQRLYERLGYKQVGTMDFATGSCVQTDLVLWKTL
ncbi:acyl-CoA N-acyltransferase [Xylariaceae sp. FL0016]|nr:acyl-CoA N-acyltransferase [Xylariaceae sp. FL0016]